MCHVKVWKPLSFISTVESYFCEPNCTYKYILFYSVICHSLAWILKDVLFVTAPHPVTGCSVTQLLVKDGCTQNAWQNLFCIVFSVIQAYTSFVLTVLILKMAVITIQMLYNGVFTNLFLFICFIALLLYLLLYCYYIHVYYSMICWNLPRFIQLLFQLQLKCSAAEIFLANSDSMLF